MARVLALMLLMQSLAQATGLVFAANELACEGPVSEDGSEGGGDDDCTPGCEDCLCCPHHRLLVMARDGVPTILDTRDLDFARVPLFVSEPEPREIMHVPKTGRSV